MKEIAEKLLEIGAVKLSPREPFTWASGWKSPIYCDNRKALSDVDVRDDIAAGLTDVCEVAFHVADVIVGV